MTAGRRAGPPAGPAVDTAAVLAAVSAVAARPLGEDDLARSWAELGVDSFTAAELLIRLEDVLAGVGDREVEAALVRSATPAELVSRLADLGGADR